MSFLTSDAFWARAGALLVFAAALADLWAFHAMGTEADTVVFMAAAGALGVHVAYGAGRQAGESATPTPTVWTPPPTQ